LVKYTGAKMATVNENALEAALEDGLIGIQLSKNQEAYLDPTVVSVNRLLLILKKEGNLNMKQIAKRMQYHENTCSTYLRWLAKHKLVKIIPHEVSSKDGRLLASLYEAI
jgi:DNA-binding MarR family transcriptional regulator